MLTWFSLPYAFLFLIFLNVWVFFCSLFQRVREITVLLLNKSHVHTQAPKPLIYAPKCFTKGTSQVEQDTQTATTSNAQKYIYLYV